MLLKYITCAFVTGFLAFAAAPAIGETLPWDLNTLSSTDLAEFRRVEKAVSESDGNDDAAVQLRIDMERFLAVHIHFMPMELEKQRLQWKRISTGMGQVIGSQSFLPIFLTYEKLAPSYGKTYRLAAGAYLDLSNYKGAASELAKAAELEPKEPWVDILWSLLHERKTERAEAVKSARAALAKSGADTEPLFDAVVLIARNYGIQQPSDVDELTQTIIAKTGGGDALVGIASGLIDRYNWQNGVIQVAAALLMEAARGQAEPSAAVRFEWARLNIEGGTMYFNRGVRYVEPSYAAVAKGLLAGLQDDPEFAEHAWDWQFALAMSDKDLAGAERLIALGESKGYSPQRVGANKAALRCARGELREALLLYDQFKLPKDEVYWYAMEQVGSFEAVRQYRWRLVEDNPGDPYALGEYADFILYRFKDAKGAIEYAQQAIALVPYPRVKQTLSMAYLLDSGMTLRTGHIDEALALYEKARNVGFDAKRVMKDCEGFDFCPDVGAVLQAFK
jgi:tetratricopeptide (TPR) repeat protein